MGEAGIFGEDDRIELIDGELIDMAPIDSRHAYTVSLLTRLFVKQAAADGLVSIQNPIQLGDHGEPQPDIAIVVNREYFTHHPQANDVLLIIEVAETSLDYDRNHKIPYYARFAIPEVWLVDVDGKRIEVYREPVPAESRYGRTESHTQGYLVAVGLPEIQVVIEDLWS